MNVTSKQTSLLLGVLAMVAVVTLVPHVFAQESATNPLGYTDQDNPTGPMQPIGWAAGMAIAGVMTGVGIWSAVRKH